MFRERFVFGGSGARMSQEVYDPLERNEAAQAEKQESAARIVSALRFFDFGMLSPVPPEIQGVTVRVA